jgi:hypothetical protein
MPAPPFARGEIVVDERGRTSLARVRTGTYDRYQVEEFSDGTLVLRPVVSASPVGLVALTSPTAGRPGTAGGPEPRAPRPALTGPAGPAGRSAGRDKLGPCVPLS